MTEHAYNPMHGPQKSVSFDRMKQILETHVHEKVEIGPMGSKAVESPKAKPAEACLDLEWKKPEKGVMAVTTKCGRYRCVKIVLNGETTYELWRNPLGAKWEQLEVRLPDFVTAQRKAQEDHAKGRAVA